MLQKYARRQRTMVAASIGIAFIAACTHVPKMQENIRASGDAQTPIIAMEKTRKPTVKPHASGPQQTPREAMFEELAAVIKNSGNIKGGEYPRLFMLLRQLACEGVDDEFMKHFRTLNGRLNETNDPDLFLGSNKNGLLAAILAHVRENPAVDPLPAMIMVIGRVTEGKGVIAPREKQQRFWTPDSDRLSEILMRLAQREERVEAVIDFLSATWPLEQTGYMLRRWQKNSVEYTAVALCKPERQ